MIANVIVIVFVMLCHAKQPNSLCARVAVQRLEVGDQTIVLMLCLWAKVSKGNILNLLCTC